MNPAVEGILEAVSKVGLAALERLPEVRAALAPYLHAKAKLTLRLDIETDGASGPLPDPVLEVRQRAVLDIGGIALEGPPEFNIKLNGAAD